MNSYRLTAALELEIFYFQTKPMVFTNWGSDFRKAFPFENYDFKSKLRQLWGYYGNLLPKYKFWFVLPNKNIRKFSFHIHILGGTYIEYYCYYYEYYCRLFQKPISHIVKRYGYNIGAKSDRVKRWKMIPGNFFFFDFNLVQFLCRQFYTKSTYS